MNFTYSHVKFIIALYTRLLFYRITDRIYSHLKLNKIYTL